MLDDRPDLSMLCQARIGGGRCYLRMEAVPVFSEGDMQAAVDAVRLERNLAWAGVIDEGRAREAKDMQAVQERAEKAEEAIDAALRTTWVPGEDDDLEPGGWGTDEETLFADRLEALAALQPDWQEWGDRAWDQAGRSEENERKALERAAVVAEALRDLLDARRALCEGEATGLARRDGAAMGKLETSAVKAEVLARDIVAGAPRSHELVPLGTQQALVDLLDANRAVDDACAAFNVPLDGDGRRRAYDKLNAAVRDRRGAEARARALVEGVERTHTPAAGWGESGAGFAPGARVVINGTAGSVVGYRVDGKVIVQVDGDGDGPTCWDPAAVSAGERTHTPSPVLSPEWVKAKHLEWAQGAHDATVMGFDEWFDLQVGEREQASSGITDEQVEAAALALAGPSPFMGGEVGDWPEAHHRAHAREVLDAALELQAGASEGHTLVPSEHLRALGGAADELANMVDESAGEETDYGRRLVALATAASEGARGGRPQWPGTGETA
jgi:hypothetical protein